MSYNAMWNYGLVRINDIQFEIGEGEGNIIFTPELAFRFKTDSSRILQKTINNRVTGTLSFVSLKETTIDKIKTLFTTLNNNQGAVDGIDDTLVIYPRFDTDLLVSENYNYACYLTSNISMIDIAKLSVGQTLTLDFESQDLHPILTTSVPEFTTFEVNNSGVIETLQFNNEGTLTDAKFKIS